LKIVPGTVHVPFHQGRNPKMRKNPDVIFCSGALRDSFLWPENRIRGNTPHAHEINGSTTN
ncbi:hypothetical protein, partial [Bifidobacterium longum]|uniref:hypothetical protein n=1 Tax=Bifidobacterium longum TaxID=216816 RepID=UPI001E2BC25C